LLLSFQSSSINPFSPISPLIPFAQVRNCEYLPIILHDLISSNDVCEYPSSSRPQIP
jgi:hypothetical protein